jgi:hypothetical protein
MMSIDGFEKIMRLPPIISKLSTNRSDEVWGRDMKERIAPLTGGGRGDPFDVS